MPYLNEYAAYIWTGAVSPHRSYAVRMQQNTHRSLYPYGHTFAVWSNSHGDTRGIRRQLVDSLAGAAARMRQRDAERAEQGVAEDADGNPNKD